MANLKVVVINAPKMPTWRGALRGSMRLLNTQRIFLSSYAFDVQKAPKEFLKQRYKLGPFSAGSHGRHLRETLLPKGTKNHSLAAFLLPTSEHYDEIMSLIATNGAK